MDVEVFTLMFALFALQCYIMARLSSAGPLDSPEPPRIHRNCPKVPDSSHCQCLY